MQVFLLLHPMILSIAVAVGASFVAGCNLLSVHDRGQLSGAGEQSHDRGDSPCALGSESCRSGVFSPEMNSLVEDLKFLLSRNLRQETRAEAARRLASLNSYLRSQLEPGAATGEAHEGLRRCVDAVETATQGFGPTRQSEIERKVCFDVRSPLYAGMAYEALVKGGLSGVSTSVTDLAVEAGGLEITPARSLCLERTIGRFEGTAFSQQHRWRTALDHCQTL